MVYAVIRVKGTVNIKPDIKKTLSLFRLTKANHCVLLDENKITKGMLQVSKDYITWGEVEKDVLLKLIMNKGKLEGDKELTDDHIKSATSFNSLNNISQAIADDKFKYKDIPNIKPIFRLNPPKKGYGGIKRSFKKGGALGYRGKEINKLLDRMI
jgi:large subunit ribosomal protein L30